MTTEQIAERLVELVREGKNVQAEQELYSDDVLSYEQNPDWNKKGLEAVMAATGGMGERIGEVHKMIVHDPKINNDTILLLIDMDITMKDGSRMTGIEYCFYKVAGGKIVEEYFYM